MDVRRRYEGTQDLLKIVGTDGCYVLCLLSIAEEVLDKPLDLIDSIHALIVNKAIGTDMYVFDAVQALQVLTGREVTMSREASLGYVAPNQYTVAKYYNDRTRYTHFRRRTYDTLDHSITVAEGGLVEYYVFEVKE